MKLEDKSAASGSDRLTWVARSRGLSSGRTAVLDRLRWMPMASAGDLADIRGRPESGVAGGLKQAKTHGLVDSTQLGCTRGQCQRWFLTDDCLSQSGLEGATWHEEAALRRLLEILPAVEGLHPVAGTVRNLGAFRQFQWFDAIGDDGPCCDAAVLYENGWIALFRCGPLLKERHLAEGLARFPRDCQALAIGSPQPWPSQIHLATADEWGREMAMRAGEDFGMERMAGFSCVADGTAALPQDPGSGQGWIFQPVRKRRPDWGLVDGVEAFPLVGSRRAGGSQGAGGGGPMSRRPPALPAGPARREWRGRKGRPDGPATRR